MSWINKLVATTLPAIPKPIVRRVSSRYIAGETKAEAVATVRELNRQGLLATLDVLGEFVATEEEARRAGAEYVEVLDVIEREGLESNVSLKLTQLGLKIDVDLCHDIARTVLETARRLGNFVRLDMEDSTCTDDTLEIYRRLREEFPGHVGCVLQAYLKRTAADVEALLPLGANVRLCKGIYIEPAAIAFKDHDDINRNFVAVQQRLLEGGAYLGIATHDDALVEAAYRDLSRLGVDRRAYEFQMLLGVREKLRAEILARGHRLRVYVPFGSNWHAYSLRRMKENPQIAGHVLRAMFNGRS